MPEPTYQTSKRLFCETSEHQVVAHHCFHNLRQTDEISTYNTACWCCLPWGDTLYIKQSSTECLIQYIPQIFSWTQLSFLIGRSFDSHRSKSAKKRLNHHVQGKPEINNSRRNNRCNMSFFRRRLISLILISNDRSRSILLQ